MKSLSSDFQDAPFYVDQDRRKMFIDFGNSLPIYENGSLATTVMGDLLVGVPLNKNPSLECSDDLQWLGLVYNMLPNWYRNSAGIQVFPTFGSLSDHEKEIINHTPLVVAEVN